MGPKWWKKRRKNGGRIPAKALSFAKKRCSPLERKPFYGALHGTLGDPPYATTVRSFSFEGLRQKMGNPQLPPKLTQRTTPLFAASCNASKLLAAAKRVELGTPLKLVPRKLRLDQKAACLPTYRPIPGYLLCMCIYIYISIHTHTHIYIHMYTEREMIL